MPHPPKGLYFIYGNASKNKIHSGSGNSYRKYNSTASNLWNFDETSFLIVLKSSKAVISGACKYLDYVDRRLRWKPSLSDS